MCNPATPLPTTRNRVRIRSVIVFSIKGLTCVDASGRSRPGAFSLFLQELQSCVCRSRVVPSPPVCWPVWRPRLPFFPRSRGASPPRVRSMPTAPKELAVLELQVQRARAATSPADRQSALRTIMKELDTKPERYAKNPAGFNLRMAQALTLWAMEPEVGYTPSRATLGFVTNPTESIDLIDALDASYKAMVTALPSCDSDVKALRQNDVWLAVTRRALDASNVGQLDSAEIYSKRSLKLSTQSPYPHYVLANVANQKKDRAAAMGHWKQVIAEAGHVTRAIAS